MPAGSGAVIAGTGKVKLGSATSGGAGSPLDEPVPAGAFADGGVSRPTDARVVADEAWAGGVLARTTARRAGARCAGLELTGPDVRAGSRMN